MRALTNTYSDCQLLNVDPQSAAHGPFIITQEGYDPDDLRFVMKLFLLRRDGQWIDEMAQEQLSEDECLEVFFESPEEAARALEALQGKPVIMRSAISAKELAIHLESLVSGGFQRRAAAMVVRYRELQRAKQQ